MPNDEKQIHVKVMAKCVNNDKLYQEYLASGDPSRLHQSFIKRLIIGEVNPSISFVYCGIDM